MTLSVTCLWVGDGNGCRHPAMYGKSYCEVHHNRVYLTMFPEMADYIIEKELKDTINTTEPPIYNSDNKGHT